MDLHPEQGDENLIIDLIYDNMSPQAAAGPVRGTDIPHGVRFWHGLVLHPAVYGDAGCGRAPGLPPAPGIHTVQNSDTGRKFAQMGRVRDFSPENGGYTSPVFEIMIAEDTDV